ncbi:MAG: RNA polymerase factor sigma-54 [Wenzhouxiangellaceae bacterium]|nr:RNA polymerase factor sigma-54 [Wenzhouxiangellaceae bacterium]
MLRTELHLRQGQHLAVTPQLQQAIRLLQLSSQELDAELSQALESNVFLERDEEPAAAMPDEGRLRGPKPSTDDDITRPEPAAAEISLGEHLNWQVEMSRMSARDREIAAVIIDALDEDGLLVESRETLLQVLAGLEVTAAEFEAVRVAVQHMEPAGCASLDLVDCLLAQAEAGGLHGARLERLQGILRNHPRLAAAGDCQALAARLDTEPAEIEQLLVLLRRLDPAPGRRFAGPSTEYIVPDVIVTRREGRWVVRLNAQALPSLKLNAECAALARQAGASGALGDQLQQARWLVKSVQMRNETLLRVAGAIVAHQRGFLERGEVAMRPMVLADMAQAVEMHESTISRVTTRKYIQTPRGIFELKYFFASRLGTRAGGRCSSTAVRALIRELINDEDRIKPLSDGHIAGLLKERGIRIARRTVAKYREAMRIPPVAERAQPIVAIERAQAAHA